MTMDGSLHRDKSTGRFSPRTMVNPAVSWYNVKDQIKPISRDTWEASSTDLHNQIMDSRKLRDQCENNTKLLGVTDPASSGRSSALRVSRSSQPPSFDSYDSSASAISWASSADPEMNQINTHAIAPFTDISTRGFQSSSNADQGPSDMALSTFTGDTPAIPQLGNSFKNVAKTSSLVNKEEKNNWESKEKSSLKLIGLERDHEENEKLSQSSGGQHIKGLWKRAFQSFRKDKNKRDKCIPDPKTEQNISDEIDPVYHLLRCAASKSQVTGALTTGKRSSNLAHHRDSSPSDVPLAKIMASTLRLASFGQSATEDVSSDKVGRKGKSNFVSFKPEPLLDEMQHQLEAAIGGAECSSERFASTSKQTMQLSTHLTNDPMSSGEKDVKLILTENRESQSLNDSCKRDLSRSNLNHRGLMKCSQKSSSFAVGESHTCRSSSPGATQINRPYNSPASSNRTTYRSSRDLRSESSKVISRRRVPLSNRIKSFSVDDKQDLDIDASTCRSTIYPAEENSCKFSSRRSVPSVSPKQMHPWRAGKELEEHNIRQSEQTQTRVKLSSTKSFSLDAPVTVISDDSGQLISGASSPGQIGLIACVNSRAQIPLRSTSGKHFMSTSARNLDTCVRFVPHAAHHVYDRRKPASVYPFFIDSAPMVTKDRCVTLYGRSTFADEKSRPHYQPTQRGTELNPNYLPGRPFVAPGCTKRAELDIQKAQAEAHTIYYVIKEYIPRLHDELQLHSNRMVNVLESSDPIWWFGICEGRSGYFPSSHVRKLEGEKTNLQP